MQEVDISDPAAWDDTELIGAYERAVNSYLARDLTARSPRASSPHLPTTASCLWQETHGYGSPGDGQVTAYEQPKQCAPPSTPLSVRAVRCRSCRAELCAYAPCAAHVAHRPRKSR